MRLLFWVCLSHIVYTYFGYPIWLALRARLRPRPFVTADIQPTVSIIISARNEESNLPAKLQNLRALDYPRDQLQIVIVSDGSTDGTNALLQANAEFILPLIYPESNGKAFALNRAVEKATGEILVFQDARQTIEPDALRELVACFADPGVGAASGELVLQNPAGESHSSALGFYWRLEKTIRKMESKSGSVVGVTGAIYAIRKELFMQLPPGTILDDVYVPMQVARQGKRVVFQASAVARDRIFSDSSKEFSRKVRTLTGNYQLLRFSPWLLTARNPLLFRFISHKLLRLLVPLSLVLILITSAVASGPFYKAALGLQVIFYSLAALGELSPPTKRLRLVSIADTFVMLNLAAVLAFYNFISGNEEVWI